MKVSNKNIYSQIAQITFFLYFFFTLFGTSLPFRSGTRDPSEIGTSNLVNQIVFSTLFITAIFSIIPKTDQIMAIIKKEKFLIIFLLWCTLGIIWAEYSFVVFKRLFQLYTAVIVCLSILVHTDDIDDVLLTFKILFSTFIILSLFSIFTVPGAVSRRYNEWQGLATSKNLLGEYCLVSVLIWIYSLFKDKKTKSILFDISMLIISLFLLIGSRSMTSISAFLILLFVWSLFEIDKLFNPIGLRRAITILSLLFVGSLVALIFVYSKEMIATVFAVGGKDLTFTGRTDLWGDVLIEAKKHLLIGCGYKGFWVVESPKILEIYETFIWLPNTSHNGYLDILNETGLIGLSVFIILIINYFIHLVKYKANTFWKWFFIIGLIENLTESVLLNAGGVITFMFLFAYLSLFANILRGERNIK